MKLYALKRKYSNRAALNSLVFFRNSSSPGGSLEFLSYWSTPKHCMSCTRWWAEIMSFAHPFNTLILNLLWLLLFPPDPLKEDCQWHRPLCLTTLNLIFQLPLPPPTEPDILGSTLKLKILCPLHSTDLDQASDS